MDYEKAYKEALSRAKRLRDSKYQTMNAKRVAEEIFPQLAESEDERIIEGFHTLIRGIRRTGGLTLNKVPLDKCEAWLEKQKESLHILEMCKENADSFTDDIIEVRSFQRGMEEGRRLEKQKEQEPVEYLDKDKIYAIMKKLHDLSFSQLIPINSDEFKKLHKITSDVSDLLDYPIEQKPAEWSEEDEKMLNEVLDSVIYAFYDQGKEGEIEDDPAFLWLHRLRPSWKPSEEQMKALKEAADMH